MKKALFDGVAYLYDEEITGLINIMDDVPFYLGYAQQAGGEALEIACGTGRALIPLAQQGITMTGIDASERMLEVARDKTSLLSRDAKKRIHLIKADMREFDLARTFPLIFCAFRSFQHLITKNEQGACLRRVYEHLSDNGVFILDIFTPFHHLLAKEKRTIYLGSFKSTKLDVFITRRSEVQYDLAQQTLHEDRFYEWTDKKGEFHRDIWSFELACIFHQEAILLLEKYGLKVIEVFGDFKKAPYNYYSGEQIFVTKKSK